MNNRILHQLDFVRKLLLTSAAFLAIAIPVVFGLFNASPTRAHAQDIVVGPTSPTQVNGQDAAIQPTFASVSIKLHQSDDSGRTNFQVMFSLPRGSYTARGITLKRLIEMAYHLQDSQISGGPEWINTALFDIDAKFDDSVAETFRQSNPGTVQFNDQAAIQNLLTEQFKLAAHSATQKAAVYDLLVDAGGPKLQPAGPTQADHSGPGSFAPDKTRMFHIGPGSFMADGTPIAYLTEQLSTHLGRPVIDKTGLKGIYSFNLHWAPDPSELERLHQEGELHGSMPADESAGPSLIDAVQQQLGLKLEPHTEPVQMMIVDHAESPSGVL